jgi:hypothetical protein
MCLGVESSKVLERVKPLSIGFEVQHALGCMESVHGIDECVKVLLYLRGFSFDSPIAILESWRFAS